MNDGSEAAELHQSNVFEIGQLSRALKLSKGQASDGYRQANDAFGLLKECRSLLEIVMDHQLQKDIQDLVCKIDKFLPIAKGG